MWPFTRKQPAPPSETGPSLPQVRFDWKGLPAIQRAISSHPLTVQTAPFASGLATHSDPRTVAKPLGHRVTLEAPPGLILDFVRPQTRNEGPELVGRSHGTHQRPVQRMRTESAAPDVEEAPMPPPFDDMPAHSEEPIRRLPALAETRPAVSLMRVTSETQPTPLPSKFEAPAAIESSAEAVSPISSETESAPDLPVYPRLTLGQVRRLGLGAPIARVPDSASTVQRSRTSDSIEAAPLPEPPPVVELASTAEAPQFQPFPLDYLITKKASPPAPTPISRRPRISPAISVSRSVADNAPANTTPPPEVDPAQEQVEPSPTASIPSTPIQRQAAAAEAREVPALQRTIDSQGTESDGGTDIDQPSGDSETSVQDSQSVELAGVSRMLETSPSNPLLSAPTTGEAAEGSAAELPALPLAAADARPSLQRQIALGDEPVNSDAQTAPLVSAAPAIATLEARQRPVDLEPQPANLTLSPQALGGKSTSSSELIRGMASAAAVSAASTSFASPVARAVASPPTVSRTVDRPSPVLQRAAEVSAATRPLTPAAPLPLASRSGFGLTAVEPQAGFASVGSGTMESRGATRLTPGSAQIQRVADLASPLPLGPVARVTQSAPAAQRVSSFDAGGPAQFFSDNSGDTGYSPMPGLPAVIQRSASQEWSVQTAPAEAPAAEASAESPATAHAAAAGTPDHTELDALANKLYDRIRVKLRHELLIDRERAGLLTDLR